MQVRNFGDAQYCAAHLAALCMAAQHAEVHEQQNMSKFIFKSELKFDTTEMRENALLVGLFVFIFGDQDCFHLCFILI